MALNLKYQEGCYLYNSEANYFELVIYQNIYKVVTISFSMADLKNPFRFHVYDLSNKIDIENLGHITQLVSDTIDVKYAGQKVGTIVDYDYHKFIFIGVTQRKVMSIELRRPLLFDYIKARDKYLAMDVLGNLSELQSEYDNHRTEYFRIPIQSENKIDWEIVSTPIPLEQNITEDLLNDKFGNRSTDSITHAEFMELIDTDTLAKIPNAEVRQGISNVIKKVFEVAKTNESVGYGQMYIDHERDIEGTRRFKVNGIEYEQVVGKDEFGNERIGFLAIEEGKTYSDNYFFKVILNNRPLSDFGIELMDLQSEGIKIVPKTEKKPVKPKKSKEEIEKLIEDSTDPDDLLGLMEEL